MLEQCFPRSARLLSGAQYKQVFARANRSSDRFFTILARTNDIEHARLGMAIAKKVDKLAVGRNRIKRVVRESFRTQVGLPELDFVVLARPAAPKASNQQLRLSLQKHWLRLSEDKSTHQNA